MKVLTIANMMKVSEKARQETPELASKVQEEYNEVLEKALTTKENNKYLTECQQRKVDEGKKQVQDYTKNIVNKVNKSWQAGALEQFNSVMDETRKIKRIIIKTDWANKYDGKQCKATVNVLYDDYNEETYTSSRTRGGNYDKESTATAGALNQVNALLQELYKKANEAIKAGQNYREYINYGITYYNTIPDFDTGVGFNCHQHILEKLGYKFEHAHSTKRTDLYIFTKE